MLRRNSLVKFLKIKNFSLLHLQVRNNQNMSEKNRNKKKFNSEVMTTFKTKFWQNAQILKSCVLEFLMKSWSRSFNQVLVSKVTLSTASLV